MLSLPASAELLQGRQLQAEKTPADILLTITCPWHRGEATVAQGRKSADQCTMPRLPFLEGTMAEVLLTRTGEVRNWEQQNCREIVLALGPADGQAATTARESLCWPSAALPSLLVSHLGRNVSAEENGSLTVVM